MAWTLLTLTQAVLSSIDGDSVSSIDDTPEATQIALAAKGVYLDIISRADLPELYTINNLDETSSSTPVIMTVPTDVDQVLWVKYDKQISGQTDLLMLPVDFLPLNDFLTMQNALTESDTAVDSMTLTIGSSSVDILYRNDKAPDWYTTYDDETLLFDSYDVDVETFLRATKSQAYVKNIPSFSLTDGFAPDLDEAQMQLWYNETKAICWAEYRQLAHQKAEVNAKRGWTKLQKSKYQLEHASPLERLPHYGRK